MVVRTLIEKKAIIFHKPVVIRLLSGSFSFVTIENLA